MIGTTTSATRGTTTLRRLAVLGLLSLCAACATAPQRGEFTFERGAASGARPDIWPPLPQVPRYAHIGTLHGQSNFRSGDTGDGAVTQLLRWVVGLGGEAEVPLTLQRPSGVATDPRGRILVTDASRQAVFVFDAQAGRLELWDRADGLRGFVAPSGIVSGPNDETWVADAELGLVARLDAGGEPLAPVGVGRLRRPTGIARDPASRRVFVADTYAHDIKVFDDSGALVAVVGRRGEGSGEFNYPTHLAFAAGELYVTDTMNARIQVLRSDARGAFAAHRSIGRRGLFIGNLVRPKGVAVDSEGNVYVSESFYDTLLIFDREGKFLMPISSGGGEGGRFYLPAGVWVDATDRVYVADMFNGRVAVFEFLGGD